MQRQFVQQRVGLVCERAASGDLEVFESRRERRVHPDEEVCCRHFTQVFRTDPAAKRPGPQSQSGQRFQFRSRRHGPVLHRSLTRGNGPLLGLGHSREFLLRNQRRSSGTSGSNTSSPF